MNFDLLIKVNRLWNKIYPYLASQIMAYYQKESGTVLELGPFSGGISVELAGRYPNLDITIADGASQVLQYFFDALRRDDLHHKISTLQTPLYPLIFEDSRFDLVICRGAFFFLDEDGNFFKEIFRVLKNDGMAFVGGGYGKDTPQALIREISDESRELNDKLGRKRVTIETLGEMIRRSGIEDRCSIVKEGGLWVVIKKIPA